MHYHLIGICGTAMASLAGLLKQQGHTVTGSDAAAYPPMSDFLAGLGGAGTLQNGLTTRTREGEGRHGRTSGWRRYRRCAYFTPPGPPTQVPREGPFPIA